MKFLVSFIHIGFSDELQSTSNKYTKTQSKANRIQNMDIYLYLFYLKYPQFHSSLLRINQIILKQQ